jgi:hypothetical protein
VPLKNARRRNKGLYSNIISNYASIILIVGVAVVVVVVVVVVSNHAWQAIFMVCVGSANQASYKNISYK